MHIHVHSTVSVVPISFNIIRSPPLPAAAAAKYSQTASGGYCLT